MSSQTATFNSARPWNWLRVGGLSASLSVHVIAVLLLAVPVAIPVLQPEAEIPRARVILEPPELPVAPVPPEPVPLRLPRHEVVSRAPPVPEVEEVSMISTPPLATADVTPVPVAFELPTDVAQHSPAHARLAYESIIEPDYPRDARRRGEHGTVILSVLVGRDGLPREVVVSRSSGYRPLDRSARDAVLRWRFRPVKVNGENVEARGLVPVRFDLDKGHG